MFENKAYIDKSRVVRGHEDEDLSIRCLRPALGAWKTGHPGLQKQKWNRGYLFPEAEWLQQAGPQEHLGGCRHLSRPGLDAII